MTMLSLGAYTRQLGAIRTTAATFINGEDIVDQKDAWVMPSTAGKPVVQPTASEPGKTIRKVGLPQGPFSTIELLVESIYDNSTSLGRGLANSILWSDKDGNNHVVTMDVINMIDLFTVVLQQLRRIPGLQDAEFENFLLHVNDFNVTSPLTRSSQQYTPHFGAQSMIICPNGKVMVLGIDRVTVASQATSRFAWRAMTVEAGHEAALMRPTIDGFQTEQATGYIELHGYRISYFMRSISEVDMVKPECNNYVHRPAMDVKGVKPSTLVPAVVPAAR
jgi:hypothetical protein